MNHQGLSLKDEIDILLNEYNAVRDEQVQNLTSGKIIASLFISVLFGIVGFVLQTGQDFLLMFAPFIVIYYFAWESGRQYSLFYGNVYLGILEEKINKLAGRKLLSWAREASFERSFIGKFRFKHKERSVISLNPLTFFPAMVFYLSLFVYGLTKGCIWLITNIHFWTPVGGYFCAFIYSVAHISFLVLFLYDMLIQRKKVMNLIEQILRAKISAAD